jgi:hypothetical protein
MTVNLAGRLANPASPSLNFIARSLSEPANEAAARRQM